MEKFPLGERPTPRIVGNVPPEKKIELQRVILDNFGEKHYEQIPEDKRKILEALEYGKKPYETAAIRGANEITNELIEEFGLKPFDVPERNIHIVPASLYQEVEANEDFVATTVQNSQVIVINAERTSDPVNRISTILHEVSHLKNALVQEALEDDRLKPFKGGLKVGPTLRKEKKTGYFHVFSGLNEAVISDIEKTYLPRMLASNEFLQDEQKWLASEEANKLKHEIAEKKAISLSEIMWVSRNGKEYGQFPYLDQRKVFNYMVEEIYKDGEFKSMEAVKKVFYRANFGGTLLSVARLIEESFGKGSFRMVGMMDTDKFSPRRVMDYLIKQRRLTHKKRTKTR